MLDLEKIANDFMGIQDGISDFLNQENSKDFVEDLWSYQGKSGGGRTRVWEGGAFIEKAGVNYSNIEGEELAPSAVSALKLKNSEPFSATGVSLVIHPLNPHIPTIHMNIRYFEMGSTWWFGGGIDVTPFYPQLEQVISFHEKLKNLCSEYSEDYFKHKQECDQYFYLKHRQETRGIGGLFFDHLNTNKSTHHLFACALGNSFSDLYNTFLQPNLKKSYSGTQRDFQLHRRSRYVEFNLIYDRGTLFGLQSQGRVESILMSMPPVAHWKYDWKPEKGSSEDELYEFYLKPQNWIDLKKRAAK